MKARALDRARQLQNNSSFDIVYECIYFIYLFTSTNTIHHFNRTPFRLVWQHFKCIVH